MIKLILQVEDDENDVLLLRHAMDKAGLVVPMQVARDGQQAVDYFKADGKFSNRAEFPLPGLVLLDLKLPILPGFDVLKAIRQHSPFQPAVIILTSSEDEKDIATAYRLGANAYVVKPNEVGKLVDVARAIKDFWIALNRPPPEVPLP